MRGYSFIDEALIQRRLWTPYSIWDRIIGWYDAADLSTIEEATAMTVWRDKGPALRNGTQSVTADKPVWSNYAITNTIADQKNFALTSMPSVPYDVICLVTISGGGANFRTLVWAGVNFNPIVINSSATYELGIYSSVSFKQAGTLTFPQSTLGFVFANFASTTSVSFMRDDSGTFSAVTSPALTTNAPTNILSAANSLQGIGSVNELIFLKPLGAETVTPPWIRQRLHGYMAHKWDMIKGSVANRNLLPGTHPHRHRPPLL